MFLTTRPIIACVLAAALALTTVFISGCGNSGSTAATTPAGSDTGSTTASDSGSTSDTATASASDTASASATDTASASDSATASATDTGSATAADTAAGSGIDAASTWVNPNVAVTAQTAPKGKGLPTFAKVLDSSGASVTNKALLGKWTVIWFYPAASTFG